MKSSEEPTAADQQARLIDALSDLVQAYRTQKEDKLARFDKAFEIYDTIDRYYRLGEAREADKPSLEEASQIALPVKLHITVFLELQRQHALGIEESNAERIRWCLSQYKRLSPLLAELESQDLALTFPALVEVRAPVSTRITEQVYNALLNWAITMKHADKCQATVLACVASGGTALAIGVVLTAVLLMEKASLMLTLPAAASVLLIGLSLFVVASVFQSEKKGMLAQAGCLQRRRSSLHSCLKGADPGKEGNPKDSCAQ